MTVADQIGGLEIEPVGSLDKYLNVLVYGEPGCGKTVLTGSAVTVPDMSPVLMIDVEGGSLSLLDFYPNVKVVRVKSWRQMQRVYDELYKGKTGYKTVIIDSLTELGKMSLAEIMAAANKGDPDIDPDVPRIRDWGKNIEQVRRMVRAFRDLPINVIFTALVDTDKDSRTNRVMSRPSLTGKLKGEIPGFVDIVMYMYVKTKGENSERYLLTRSTGSEMAKDRSNKLPMVVENPSMETIYNTIIAQRNEG